MSILARRIEDAEQATAELARDVSALELVDLRAQVATLQEEKWGLWSAMDAMVIVLLDGEPCYRTRNSVPMEMPPRARRLVTAALRKVGAV
ncbi:hypothetical protein LCGC14_0312870 [marine sediment metagenome]|uniref:Uncharacterized protein n=1 Tax=marine sediment metagenome TaxID=412755 RepID=A0A0F9TLJ3_9ZZZZ